MYFGGGVEIADKLHFAGGTYYNLHFEELHVWAGDPSTNEWRGWGNLIAVLLESC